MLPLTQDELHAIQIEILARHNEGLRVRTGVLDPIEMNRVDDQNAQYVKGLISDFGWIDVTRFGEDASKSSWLMIQHCSDVNLMVEILPKIKIDVDANLMPGECYALLYDRIAIMKGEKQRFGSQVKINQKGEWVLYSLENPDQVDVYRSQYGLSSLSDNMKRLKDMYEFNAGIASSKSV